MRGTVVEAYLRDCERRGLSARTVESYKERLGHLERTVAVPAHTLSRDQIQAWIDGRGSPASRAAHRSTVVQFYGWLVEEGYSETNEAARTRAPKVTPGRPRPIPSDDINRAITAADDRMRAAIMLGCYAGLRVAEMAGLRWPDINFGESVIDVSSGKGGKDRVVPLHVRLEKALVALGPGRRGAVIVTRNGTPFAPRELGVRIAEHLRGLGIEATAHQLRHSFASMVYEETRDIRATAKLLGHASTTTTEVYARYSISATTQSAVRHLGGA